MGDGDGTVPTVHGKRLRVLDVAAARGGVPNVADGATAGQLFDLIGREDILHQTHPAMDKELLAVARHDTCGFLASVLQ